MIHTDGRPTIANRVEAIDPQRKAAHRLKALAPRCYARAVEEGRLPDVGDEPNYGRIMRDNRGAQ